MTRLASLIAVMLLGAPAMAAAGDYKPVRCAASKPWAGKSVRAPVTVPDFGSIGPAPLDRAARDRLDTAAQRLASLTSPGTFTAAVADSTSISWQGGDAPDRQYFWASAGKTFTAVVVLQLVEEGKLSLDDPIERFFPGLPNGAAITIRHLLDHRSGLFSANEDPKLRAARRYFPPQEQMAVLKRHGAMFCPGEQWRYTNSGYALLGAVIERLDGMPFEQAIQRRIVARLGLRHTRALTPGSATTGIAPLRSAQEEPMDPSWAGAAGPVVASPGDMLAFWQALFGGRLVAPATVSRMFDPLYPMFDSGMWYGLGVMAIDVPQKAGGTKLWLGHAGGTPGAGALVVWLPEQRRFIAAAVTGDAPAPAIVNLLAAAASGEGAAEDAR